MTVDWRAYIQRQTLFQKTRTFLFTDAQHNPVNAIAFAMRLVSIFIAFNTSRSKPKAKILQTNFQTHFLDWKCIPHSHLTEFASHFPIDTNIPLLQVMAWCREGTNPLPDAMFFFLFAAPYMRHQSSMHLPTDNTFRYWHWHLSKQL